MGGIVSYFYIRTDLLCLSVMHIKIISYLFFTTTCLAMACQKSSSGSVAPPVVLPAALIRGADLSFLPLLESVNTRFYDADSLPKDLLTQFKDNGCNTVRLRLWHNPADVHSSLAEVMAMAGRVRAKGMKVWLCLHYADTWADPGNQPTPAAWQGLGINLLSDSIYQYTKRVVTLIRPDYVQVGNEINGGMLWETGRIANQASFITLLKAGIRGCREGQPTARIMLHYAGTAGADWFFNLMKQTGTDYDMVALSYYPIWHGKSLDAVETAMQVLHTQTGKPVCIAETAYPFTLGWKDYTHNVLGLPEQCIPGFPASPQGQLNFMQALTTRIRRVPGGAGFCYWGGEYVAFRSDTSTNGSSWENMALFNFSNKALPAMTIFKP